MKMRIITVLAVCFLIAGCSTWERDTFNSLAASKAVIDTAQKDYTAGTIKETACTYAVINKAKTVQTVAVESLEVYHAANSASNQAAATLALADVVPLIAEVKTLYSNPTGCKLP